MRNFNFYQSEFENCFLADVCPAKWGAQMTGMNFQTHAKLWGAGVWESPTVCRGQLLRNTKRYALEKEEEGAGKRSAAFSGFGIKNS